MQLAIPTTRPFSFAQTLAFIDRFPPCRGDYVATPTSLTAAVCVGSTPIAFTLRAARRTIRTDRADTGESLSVELSAS
ncbi:MAG: hypothetical protein HOV81_25250, partial [Kofleriaceae bacterium]|nr:hypothetical protein [Kofleriaceae bacterium]